MKLSIVIPTFTINKELEQMAHDCAYYYFFNPDVYEVIVCEDGGFYSNQISAMSNVYIYSKDNVGFTKNVNRGLKIASGDYIAVVNSDTQIAESKTTGSLLDLCIPGKVACPITLGQDVPLLAGHFFVAPYDIWKEVEYLDERMHTFCSDADFERKVKDRIVQVPTVSIYHEIGSTLNAASIFQTERLEEDRKIYHALQYTQD
jgi:GT2 family glycosyltransferase